MKYGELNLGQIEAIGNKLGGENGIRRFLADELAVIPTAERDRDQISRPTIVTPTAASFEIAKLDTDGFLQAATCYFNQRWQLHEFDPSKIVPPSHRQGFGWGLIVPPANAGITAQRVFEKLRERFTVWKYTDSSLDETIDLKKEARQPGKSGYAIWCRPVVEADDCHKNKSANAIAKLELNTMGLTERLLLEDFVLYLGWAEHLDMVNATLCAGSRSTDGGVPGVYWGPGLRGLDVRWYYPDGADGSLRAREVVSADAPKAAA